MTGSVILFDHGCAGRTPPPRVGIPLGPLCPLLPGGWTDSEMTAQLQCLDEGLESCALQRDIVSLFGRGVRICDDANMDDIDAFSLGFIGYIRHLLVRVPIVFKEPIRHDDREDFIVDGNDNLIGELPGFSVSVSQYRCL